MVAGRTNRQRTHLSANVKAQIVLLVVAAIAIALLVGFAVLTWLETTA